MAAEHQHTETEQVIHRLSRAIGHLESVKRMVEEGRDCSEVLVQIAAVRSAVNNIGKLILRDHMEHCVAALQKGDTGALAQLNTALVQFIK